MTTATMSFAEARIDLSRARPVKSGINHVRYSSDGSLLASSDVYMHVKLARGNEVVMERDFNVAQEKIRPTQRIRGLEFNGDASAMFVAAADTLYAVDSATGQDIWTYTPPRAWAFLIVSPLDLAAAPGLVAAAFDNGAIGVWSEDGIPQALWHSNDGPRMLDFVAGSDHLVGSDSFSINVWDWQQRKSVAKQRLRERVYGFATSPSLRIAATRTLHGIDVWDLELLSVIGTLPVGQGLPVMAFHPTQRLLALGERHGARIVDFEGNQVRSITIDEAIVISLGFSGDGSELAVGCSDSEIRRLTV
jgi:WD40 repeat protein